MATTNLTAARLRELLTYDPETGVFTWAISRPGASLGVVAGCTDPRCGYVMIRVERRIYRAHRLAFLWMTGRWPIQVDHRDRVRSNNRWSNLREATQKQNNENMSLHSRNTSGHKGVHWAKRHKAWAVSIGHNGKKYMIGMRKNLADAIQLRLAAERRYFTHSPACET